MEMMTIIVMTQVNDDDSNSYYYDYHFPMTVTGMITTTTFLPIITVTAITTVTRK